MAVRVMRPVCTAHWMSIQCNLIASTLQTRKTKPDQMRIKPIHFWRWIESGLEWNVSICVVACLQFHPLSATMQMLIVKVRGFGKGTPTSHSYHVIIRGHAHNLLFQSILQIYSADAIKSGSEPVPVMRIQSKSDPIAVPTGLWTGLYPKFGQKCEFRGLL